MRPLHSSFLAHSASRYHHSLQLPCCTPASQPSSGCRETRCRGQGRRCFLQHAGSQPQNQTISCLARAYQGGAHKGHATLPAKGQVALRVLQGVMGESPLGACYLRAGSTALNVRSPYPSCSGVGLGFFLPALEPVPPRSTVLWASDCPLSPVRAQLGPGHG